MARSRRWWSRERDPASSDLTPAPGEWTPPRPWHALEAAEVAALLGTADAGLGPEEAAGRLARVGANRIPEEPPPSALVLLLRQFANPLILILVVAAGVTLVMGELLDTLLIALALALNAVIGFTQEHRAAGAVQALMQLVTPRAHVVRGGQEGEIDSGDLVPGDVVVLEPGCRVPADLRLSEVNALEIDESLLTGESLPTSKQTHATGESAILADRRSMAFTGAIVTSGRGRGYVVTTGQSTELGSIAGMIRVPATAPPLQKRMEAFARVIGVSILIACVITFVSGIALGESADQMFHTVVAMAVSAVPEGLPVAVTVTLAIGVSRMARRNAVLRRLSALETLGSTDVIGSDKTGTLTENRMTVEAIWTPGHWYAVPGDVVGRGAELGEDALGLTLATGVLTNEATVRHTEDGHLSTGDPTEVALLVAAERAGTVPEELQVRHRLIAEIPFEPERRYSASFRDVAGTHTVFVKGAPERVVDMCTRMLTDEGPVPIDARAVDEAARELAGRGLRVLAMAMRRLPPAHGRLSTAVDDEVAPEPEDLVLVGLQGMMDPPRAGVQEAIAACREAGIRVLMITGDHAVTARAVAARLGIVADAEAPILTGTELADLDDAELERVVVETSVFARVSPEEKLRIVQALQAEGRSVAVTGDGVNDAPALRAAGIGVAMGRGGTDVARQASDMVLSDDNFVSIVSAVEEGRIAFANIRKASFFLISTALAETVAIMLSVWLGWPLLLVPAQILWLNLVTNGVQDLALAFEPGSPDVLRRPPRDRTEGVLSRLMWERTALVGVVMAIGALAVFRYELDRTGSLVAAQTAALTTLVVFNVFQVGNARTEKRSLFTISPFGNRFLFWATTGAVGLHIGALYFGPTQYVLGVQPIELATWGLAIAVASTILLAVETHKAIRRRWPLR